MEPEIEKELQKEPDFVEAESEDEEENDEVNVAIKGLSRFGPVEIQ